MNILQYTVILTRNYDDNPIIKTDGKENGIDILDEGKVVISNFHSICLTLN